MNKDYSGALVYVALVLCAFVLIANYLTSTRDFSWISEVENFIQKENWRPDIQYEPIMLWSFFLWENGTEQFFCLANQKEFISCINSIMDRIDRRIKESISKELLNEILASRKVMSLVHRFSTQSFMWSIPPNEFGSKIDYRIVYFVLEDTTETDLEGTIIVRENLSGEPNYKYSVWQISK